MLADFDSCVHHRSLQHGVPPVCRMIVGGSKGARSGPVPLDKDDDALARLPGSLEDLRVRLALTGRATRHGATGIRVTPIGRWTAAVFRVDHGSTAILELTFASKSVAQEVRDAALTIIGDGWVSSSSTCSTSWAHIAKL